MHLKYIETSYLELVWYSKNTRNIPNLVSNRPTTITAIQKMVIVENKPVGRDFWTILPFFFVKFTWFQYTPLKYTP